MNRRAPYLLLTFLGLFGSQSQAWSQVPLNTGYNNAAFFQYPALSMPPPLLNATTLDQYWITIASYPAVSPPVGPAWVLQKAPPWIPALPNTNWIGPRKAAASAPGTSADNPSYALFRKCFCLMRGFKDAKLNFKIRADDKVQVWLNTMTTQLLAPMYGSFGGPTLPLGGGFAGTQNQSDFVLGKNCLYVLVEDQGGHLGFDLEGAVSAVGLLPVPAAGADQTFEPCSCNTGKGTAGMSEVDDRKVIADIVKIAEQRRLEKKRPQ